ncbi:unnamed protein product [Rotaria socialis]|nr:unnamed protein product [Rotaria socialis]
MELNGVSVFGIKDYLGNVQSIHAIQTNNAIYSFKNGRIVQIQSMNEAFIFNYNNSNNQYGATFVSQNGSYEIPATYETPNITFPTPVFELPSNQSIPNYFTGIVIVLQNKISNQTIDDATLQMNYFDSQNGKKSSVMINVGGGRYYTPLPTNDTTMDSYFDRNKLLKTIIQQSNASIELIEVYPISDICSKAPDSAKSFCTLIMQDTSVKILDALRIASNYISDFPFQSGSLGQLNNFEIVQLVPGEEPETVSLNSNNQTSKKTVSFLRNVDTSIDPNTLNTVYIQSNSLKGQCNEQTVSGGDIPDDRIIDIGKAHTNIKFLYETYTIKDEIDVHYMNQQVFSTGCVGANGAAPISLNGNERTIRVNVIPDCAGETGTGWYYTVECAGELICADDVCYCGLSQSSSHQKIPATYNGCGAKNSWFNWYINPVGDFWKFTPACNGHDLCYGKCNNHKSSCDTTFLAIMLASCKANFFLLLLDCLKNAEAFYIAVDWLGHGPFVSAQNEDCECITS